MYATRAVQAQIGNFVKFASRDSAVTHINSTTGNIAFLLKYLHMQLGQIWEG